MTSRRSKNSAFLHGLKSVVSCKGGMKRAWLKIAGSILISWGIISAVEMLIDLSDIVNKLNITQLVLLHILFVLVFIAVNIYFGIYILIFKKFALKAGLIFSTLFIILCSWHWSAFGYAKRPLYLDMFFSQIGGFVLPGMFLGYIVVATILLVALLRNNGKI